jgi:hypothetical protein
MFNDDGDTGGASIAFLVSIDDPDGGCRARYRNPPAYDGTLDLAG